ncbi:nucleotide sugar dehydrogenase [Patescibacteria group bacterium]|nr:nucleotide sugar dehydrogenase [Patescibacteria group bacterium]MBU4512928.1 nucleotide sugar dehydrogenase [Patescibacteria group bacterium]
MKKNIVIIGSGYVGTVVGACLAKLDHSVTCVDKDRKKITKLKKGFSPIYEPGLEELLRANLYQGRLHFTTSLPDALKSAEVIFIAVGTPSKPDGSCEMKYVWQVAHEIGRHLDHYAVIVDKSTVPVGTAGRVRKIIESYKKTEFDIVSNPEFQREGSSIKDFLGPDRIVLGADSPKAKRIMRQVYKKIKAPKLIMDIASAEMVKYAANAFLATKISYINEIANICEHVDADVDVVAEGVGMDRRIGYSFMKAGLGYGGSCLTENEIIIIKKGNQIKSIKIKDLFNQKYIKSDVLSFDINKRKVLFRPIINITKRKYKGDIVFIKSRMNKMLSCTEDHPFISYEDSRFKLKLAKDLLLTDRLPCFTSMPYITKGSVIDVISILPKDKFDYKKVRVRPVGKQFLDVKERLSSFKASRLRDILRSNCMNLEEFLKTEMKTKDKISRKDLVLFTSRGKTTYCPAVIKIDNDFCRLLGYYISEGNIHYEKNLRGTRARINIHFNSNEKEYINDLTNIFNKYSLKFGLRGRKDIPTKSFYFSSIIWAYLLNNHLGCGKDSYSADVPDMIFSLDKDKKAEFLRGLFRGDGHVAFPKGTNSVVYDYGSISYSLTHKCILLFNSIGIVPSYKTSISKKSSDYAHFFRVSTKKQIEALSNFKDKKTQRKINQVLSNCKDIKSVGFKRVNSDFCAVEIKELKKEYKEVDVYSLEVKDTQTFITSHGLIVHNCFPKDVKALHNIAFQDGYDFKLLKSVIRVNQQQRELVANKVKRMLGRKLKGKTVAVLGLAFKNNTDDVRESAAIDIIKILQKSKIKIQAYDPIAIENAKKVLDRKIKYFTNPYKAVTGADALLIATEWPEFIDLNWKRIKKLMKCPKIVDGRNLLERAETEGLGFEYCGVGK